jgi:hypothetical protein
MKEAADYAMRIASKMSRDPEALSVANENAERALRTFDETKGVPVQRWVAFVVRQSIWDMWRRKARHPEELCEEEFWFDVSTPRDNGHECPLLGLDPVVWTILCEHYVEKWCIDVVAKRHGMTVYAARKLMKQAVEYLEWRFLP